MFTDTVREQNCPITKYGGQSPVCKIARFSIAILRKTLLSVAMRIPASIKILPMTEEDIDVVMENRERVIPPSLAQGIFRKRT